MDRILPAILVKRDIPYSSHLEDHLLFVFGFPVDKQKDTKPHKGKSNFNTKNASINIKKPDWIKS